MHVCICMCTFICMYVRAPVCVRACMCVCKCGGGRGDTEMAGQLLIGVWLLGTWEFLAAQGHLVVHQCFLLPQPCPTTNIVLLDWARSREIRRGSFKLLSTIILSNNTETACSHTPLVKDEPEELPEALNWPQS